MSEQRKTDDLSLHAEELDVGVTVGDAGSVRARKQVEHEDVTQLVPLEFERAQIEHAPAAEGDSGQIETLPDGSISIPLLEEELVVSKRVVVRERIVIRKETVMETREVRAELGRERLEIDTPEDSSPTKEVRE